MKDLVITNKQISAVKQSIVDGLAISSGARSSATYYHKKEDQDKAIRAAIVNLYNQSKELPLILANQKGATGKFIQEVLLNEFKKGTTGGACNIINPQDWYDEGLSDKAILGALHNLNDNGITYVLRLLKDFSKNKINNERARKIALGFIFNHPNIEFNVLKYRNKMKEILTHIYGVKTSSILLSIAKKFVKNGGIFETEKDRLILTKHILKYSSLPGDKLIKLFLFLNKEAKATQFKKSEFPIIFEYWKAYTDVTSVSFVPEEVLVGLISNVNHPQYSQLWATKDKRKETIALIREKTKVTSVNQQVRQTKANKALGVEKAIDYAAATDFMALYKTGYENGFTPELRSAIDNLAESKKYKNFAYKNVGIVLDRSNSMNGHTVQSKNTPKAIADFTARVLSKSSVTSKLIETDGQTTQLADAFIELLRQEGNTPYDAIFVLTDGYENDYDGLLNEVIKVYKDETDRVLPIFQVSPIVGAETNANVRSIGSEVLTMAITKPQALVTQIASRMLEADTKQWLLNEFKAIEQLPYTRVNSTVNSSL